VPFDAVRPVTVLAAGGTIAMRGERAQPAMDAEALVAAVPELAGSELEVRSLRSLPGAAMGLGDALAVAEAARAETERGHGVVVTHGTDTIEETAFLCDLVCDAEAPVVVTGAIRPASATGADGPANLRDAVAAAGAGATAGLGALVAFAGELHAARAVRKVDSVSPAAFGSPRTGPVGAVREGRVQVWARVARRPAIHPERLDARVEIVGSALGDDGALLRAAAGMADGLVAVVLGAGHAPPGFLAALRDVAARLPVVVTVRPERGAMLRATYGFEGAKGDVRASGAIPAAGLSPAAARIKLIACLGAGLGDDDRRGAFAPDDD
jgi:L-asparaginase